MGLGENRARRAPRRAKTVHDASRAQGHVYQIVDAGHARDGGDADGALPGRRGLGQRDDDSWAAIVSCLQQRKVAMFKDYLVYSRAELVSMLKALDLKKTPLSYLNAIEEASGLKAEVAVPRRVGVRCSR